jgi:hypothetical protein
MSHEQKFQELLTQAGIGTRREALFANIQTALRKAEIPLVETIQGTLGTIDKAPAGAAAGTNYQCSVKTYWWGIEIVMNEDLTQAIATGAIVGPPLATLVSGALVAAGVLSGGIAAVIGGAFATALALKIVQIKLTDQGQGVYWPISWLQWAAVAAAVPGGPAAIVAAILIFFHPVPN